MRTIEVKDITDDYRDNQLKKYYDIMRKKYQKNFGLYDGFIPSYDDTKYLLMYLITIECDNGLIEEIKFGFNSNHSIDIIGGRIENYDINEKIREFCEVYGEELLSGISILDVIENDELNILNYKKNNRIRK